MVLLKNIVIFKIWKKRTSTFYPSPQRTFCTLEIMMKKWTLSKRQIQLKKNTYLMIYCLEKKLMGLFLDGLLFKIYFCRLKRGASFQDGFSRLKNDVHLTGGLGRG